MKNLLFFLLLSSVISVRGQVSPLTSVQKERMDSLNRLMEYNRKLEILDASLKKVFKKSGKFYATIEWNNRGTETIISFSGKLSLRSGGTDGDLLLPDIRPLAQPLLPNQPQFQDYELPENKFRKLTQNDNNAWVIFSPQILQTTGNTYISREVNVKELARLSEQDKDYNIYKETSERQQKYLQNEAKLNLLTGKFLKIDIIDGVPMAICSFTNKGATLVENYAVSIKVWENDEENSGWSISDGMSEPLKPGASVQKTCSINNIDISKMEFPVTDLKRYNLHVNYSCDMITINGIAYRKVEFTEKDKVTLSILEEKYTIR